uniref:O-fucosyltransferase family protein n=1 Tax=Anthurium amnicola TaxID=1678845 RepID=A0A1D1XIT6_9ARAE
MLHKSKIKLVALVGIALSVASLIVHLYITYYSSSEFIYYKPPLDDFYGTKFRFKMLWGPVDSLELLQPYANPRKRYSVPSDSNNGYVYAKIYGGFEKIRSSICDVVTIARLLNATLVIPEIQESLRSKGISSKFRSFSYLYNEEQFIAALTNDVTVVRSLPTGLQEDRKKNKFPIYSPQHSASPSFYLDEVLPKLKESKVIGLVITGGGCLQSILPPTMAEYQRLRCRVAFVALHFRPEIKTLGDQIIDRLRASGQPYIAYHPGLVKDTLAFHGCAGLFQDVHTELIQYRRKQLIKRGILHEELIIDSTVRRRNGSCPLMPEEVGLLLRAMGYPPSTIIYVAGVELFGGQRILIPLRAMYTNLVDRTSLCSKKEFSRLIGPEYPLPSNIVQRPPAKSEQQLIQEWKKAGPRPRPLPPPPARPFYQYEKDGWYGWVTETAKEPVLSPIDLRNNAHRLLWDALDYHVSVESDAFFPGFNNDGSGWPDFSSLVMGHRLYQMASGVTYRPDRKTITQLFDAIRGRLYHPKRNWTTEVRGHLNKSLGMEGLILESHRSKPMSFLSHPLPECSCRTSSSTDIPTEITGSEGEGMCPEWMMRDLVSVSFQSTSAKDDVAVENDSLGDDMDKDSQTESDGDSKTDVAQPLEQYEEMMDPDD